MSTGFGALEGTAEPGARDRSAVKSEVEATTGMLQESWYRVST